MDTCFTDTKNKFASSESHNLDENEESGMHKASHKHAPLKITPFQRHNTILCREQALSLLRGIKLRCRMWCSQNTCICKKVLIALGL